MKQTCTYPIINRLWRNIIFYQGELEYRANFRELKKSLTTFSAKGEVGEINLEGVRTNHLHQAIIKGTHVLNLAENREDNIKDLIEAGSVLIELRTKALKTPRRSLSTLLALIT